MAMTVMALMVIAAIMEEAVAGDIAIIIQEEANLPKHNNSHREEVRKL
jgi:hypothetical protein